MGSAPSDTAPASAPRGSSPPAGSLRILPETSESFQTWFGHLVEHTLLAACLRAGRRPEAKAILRRRADRRASIPVAGLA